MSALPILFTLVVYQINPQLISFLWTDKVGIGLSALASVLLLLGAIWVRQTVCIRL